MFNPKKICIVATSLGKGGAERSSALLSKLLSDLGYTIHIVIIVDAINNDYEGELLNIGNLEKGHSLLAKIRKFRIFKNYLKTNDFDFVIDNRSRPNLLREFIVSRWLYEPQKTIYSVHSYKLETYFPPIKTIAKYIYRDAYKLVAVSEEIRNAITSSYGLKNVLTIYNPVGNLQFQTSITKKLDSNYILFYGRINDDIKNISLLIESYRKSKLPEHHIKLMILGDGIDLDVLKLKVEAEKLQNHVIFKPFMNNPYAYVKYAKFTVLTSRYEGFPMSVLESLALGTPVISVDCKSGPSEMIVNEVNGLLVENYNSNALAKALNRFINDSDLYQTCKANATKSVEPFSMESIAKDWQKLLN